MGMASSKDKKWWLTPVLKTLIGMTLILGAMFVVFGDVYAKECILSSGTKGECLENPLQRAQINDPTDIPKLIGMVLRALFAVIGVVALVMFIYGGVLWMTAFGEEQRVKRGLDTMIWASLGLLTIFGSYVAVDFILKAILG